MSIITLVIFLASNIVVLLSLIFSAIINQLNQKLGQIFLYLPVFAVCYHLFSATIFLSVRSVA